MFLDSAPGNAQGALSRIQVLRTLRGDTDTVFGDAAMVADGLRPDGSYFSVRTPACPAAYLAWSGQSLFAFVDGIDTDQMGAAIWDAYLGSYYSSTDQPQNAWFAAAASYLNTIFTALNLATFRNIYLTGYSAGGAIACYMSTLFPSELPRQAIYVSTFGSPKPGGRDFAASVNGYTIARWMNFDDPVPLVPPTLGAWVRITAGISVAQNRTLASYRQTDGGLNVTDAAVITPAVGPSAVNLQPSDAVGRWLNALQTLPSSGHSLNQYLARINLAVTNRTVPASGGFTGGDDDPTPEPTRRQVIKVYDAAQAGVIAFAQPGGEAQVVIPQGQSFYAQRDGRIWNVYFGGQQVASAPFKKRAHHLARVGNDFLKSLQIEGQVRTDTLAGLFQLYLDEASKGGNGFDPPMNAVNNM
jgi:hypothetical protein